MLFQIYNCGSVALKCKCFICSFYSVELLFPGSDINNTNAVNALMMPLAPTSISLLEPVVHTEANSS